MVKWLIDWLLTPHILNYSGLGVIDGLLIEGKDGGLPAPLQLLLQQGNSLPSLLQALPNFQVGKRTDPEWIRAGLILVGLGKGRSWLDKDRPDSGGLGKDRS